MGAETEILFQGDNSAVRRFGSLFCKTAAPEILKREEAVLQMLAGGFKGLYAPRLAGRDGDTLLSEALPGTNLAIVFAQAEGDTARRERLAAEFGRALRVLHGWVPPIPRPGFDWLDHSIARAAAAAIPYDGGTIDDPRSPFVGWKAEKVVHWARTRRPAFATELAFGHGDWCLPNVLIEEETITGAIDWPDGGWADFRYDLATGLWTLRYNAGDDGAIGVYERRFLDGYGYGGSVESLRLFEALYALI